MAYVGATPAKIPLTSSDLADSIVTADKLATDAVETAKVKNLNVTNAKIAASTIDVTSKITGVVPAANLGSGTASSSTYLAGDSTYKTISEYDDDKLQSNIALLGFKTAVNGSLAKYNLQDQIIDEYEDNSGIDTGNSTNEFLLSGAYVGQTGTNPTGATSTDTSVAGYTTLVLSAASGNLVIGSSGNVDVLVVGGGGSGGNSYAGGGGAGGLIYKAAHALTAQTYAWVTGAGGAGVTSNSVGNVGADSTWTDASASVEFTAKGGGGGSKENNTGTDGGSGAGAGHHTTNATSEIQSAQSGDSGTYGFGFDGGQGVSGPNYNPGGGGGAGSVGAAGTTSASGNGGTGKDMSAIFGTAVGDSGWFASGGGGAWTSEGTSVAGTASSGGGTAGGTGIPGGDSSAGAANTGGGSGGTCHGGNSGAGGSGIILLRYADGAFETTGLDLTLQSTANTASSAATKADLIMLMENAEGTATINTDIKGYVTADGGSNWTEGTLVDEGSWGTNKKILAFHDATVTSGTDMRYKITTHNQSAGSKETKIHATSIGWR